MEKTLERLTVLEHTVHASSRQKRAADRRLRLWRGTVGVLAVGSLMLLPLRPGTAQGPGSNLTDRVAALEAKVDALQATVNTHTTQIAALQTTVGGHTTQLSGLQSTVGAHATQIGGLQTTVANHTTQLSSLQSTVGAHTAQLGGLQTTAGNHTTLLSSLQTTSNTHTSQISGLQTTAGNHTTQLANLQFKLFHFSRSGNDVFVTGANLHILNGKGHTRTLNGVGNLIVGYNEARPYSLQPDVRTGSHNIIVGDGHNFTGAGGFVAGMWNQILNDYATVTGGNQNTAGGVGASVTGGGGNRAAHNFSVVSGGLGRSAPGMNSWAAGTYVSAN